MYFKNLILKIDRNKIRIKFHYFLLFIFYYYLLLFSFQMLISNIMTFTREKEKQFPS